MTTAGVPIAEAAVADAAAVIRLTTAMNEPPLWPWLPTPGGTWRLVLVNGYEPFAVAISKPIGTFTVCK